MSIDSAVHDAMGEQSADKTLCETRAQALKTQAPKWHAARKTINKHQSVIDAGIVMFSDVLLTLGGGLQVAEWKKHFGSDAAPIDSLCSGTKGEKYVLFLDLCDARPLLSGKSLPEKQISAWLTDAKVRAGISERKEKAKPVSRYIPVGNKMDKLLEKLSKLADVKGTSLETEINEVRKEWRDIQPIES